MVLISALSSKEIDQRELDSMSRCFTELDACKTLNRVLSFA